MKNLNHGASRAKSRGHSSGHTEIHEIRAGGEREEIESERERETRNKHRWTRGGRRFKHSIRVYAREIEPMGRVRRMQISPITHTGYFAVIIAVHARGRISYDVEFRGYPSRLEKFTVKYCPLNPEPAGRSYFCNTS